MIIKMKEFDLFKLHNKEDKTPRKWICAIETNLNRELDYVIEEIIKNKGQKIVRIKVKKENITSIYRRAILKAGNQKNLSNILSVTRQDIYKCGEGKRKVPLKILINLIKYANLNINLDNIILQRQESFLYWNKQRIAKVLARRLNVSINFTEKIIYRKRKEVAIIFILELLNLWKKLLNKTDKEFKNKQIEIQNTFEFFKQNQIRCKEIKVVKNLDIILSNIVGAMLADGSISSKDSSISLVEEGKLSVETFSKWIEIIFGLTPNVRKVEMKNAWVVKIDNKPIQSYLTMIFNFNRGKKRKEYDIPYIIKNSNLEIRKACVKGIMIFDGVVRTKREVGLNIGSKQLRDSVFDILIEDKMKITKLKNPDITGMWKLYSSGLQSKEQHTKWLEYFIEDSDKWCKIYEWINGFQGRVSSIENALIILEKSFSRKSASKITLAEIFNLFIIHRQLTITNLLDLFCENNINVSEVILWNYTSILRQMNLITKKRLSDNTNLYIYNKNIFSWRLPYRYYLSSYYS